MKCIVQTFRFNIQMERWQAYSLHWTHRTVDTCCCFHVAVTFRKFAAQRNESNSSTHQHSDRGSFAIETLCIVMRRAKKYNRMCELCCYSVSMCMCLPFESSWKNTMTEWKEHIHFIIEPIKKKIYSYCQCSKRHNSRLVLAINSWIFVFNFTH